MFCFKKNTLKYSYFERKIMGKNNSDKLRAIAII